MYVKITITITITKGLSKSNTDLEPVNGQWYQINVEEILIDPSIQWHEGAVVYYFVGLILFHQKKAYELD